MRRIKELESVVEEQKSQITLLMSIEESKSSPASGLLEEEVARLKALGEAREKQVQDIKELHLREMAAKDK